MTRGTNVMFGKKDILNALRAFCDLRPAEDVYVRSDGSSFNLLCLDGTIPVKYKGNVYNIPIRIWLLTSHPFSAPLVYVRPAQNMVIKPSKHVDNAGRVYMPYLSEWKGGKSDSYSMINMLCMIFGEFCPVYSKPPAGQPQPRPAYPTTHYNHTGGPGYPTHNTGMPQPGYPTRPPAYPPTQPNYTPYPKSSNPATSSYQTPATTAIPPSRPPQPAGRQESVIQEETVRISLLQTAEDKLKRRVKEVFQMGQDEIGNLKKKKVDLESGNKQLQDMIKKMNEEKANLESNISVLEQKSQELSTTLEKLEQDSENMNIDDAVVTTAPLYNQILKLFAEENAIEDTMYYLSEALRKGVIESDVFLRTVRDLSRKQFILRAKLQKARATAGLSSNPLGR